ncbi:MAG TPA: MBL fold metallo-hydrolase [Polyangiales bacterium]|nr:MBL fold metallo-hydrolase [Polyangiales bacterium]
MSKRVRGVLIGAVLLGSGAFAASRMTSVGGSVEGERRVRAERSGHYREGHFQNLEPTHMLTPGTFWPMLEHQLFGTEQRVPERAIPVVQRSRSDYATAPASGLRATWIGHASVLLEIDGTRVLVDPVFSARCSPLAFMGPERFFPPPIALAELPAIHVVVISHDHYDHLDMASVQALAANGAVFVVPLGIGAHLERWGVPVKQIVDLDWYEQKQVGRLQLTATPARHYSGRRVLDSDATLWASWVIAGDAHRVFFSGDTGYSAEFSRIGQRFGPFDLTLIKIGASDPTWEQIHMSPEDAVRTHQDVRGRLLLPVHWGTFNLANHAWNEPAERAAKAASAAGVSYALPRPGEWVEPGVSQPTAAWWR